mmetsp:Transcript_3902/g.12383  ORF Transcript_3902/g.12383 Transcript_3902/m.12383 type:complete len:960 (-) Transcript_3902:411-3290(-)
MTPAHLASPVSTQRHLCTSRSSSLEARERREHPLAAWPSANALRRLDLTLSDSTRSRHFSTVLTGRDTSALAPPAAALLAASAASEAALWAASLMAVCTSDGILGLPTAAASAAASASESATSCTALPAPALESASWSGSSTAVGAAAERAAVRASSMALRRSSEAGTGPWSAPAAVRASETALSVSLSCECASFCSSSVSCCTMSGLLLVTVCSRSSSLPSALRCWYSSSLATSLATSLSCSRFCAVMARWAAWERSAALRAASATAARCSASWRILSSASQSAHRHWCMSDREGTSLILGQPSAREVSNHFLTWCSLGLDRNLSRHSSMWARSSRVSRASRVVTWSSICLMLSSSRCCSSSGHPSGCCWHELSCSASSVCFSLSCCTSSIMSASRRCTSSRRRLIWKLRSASQVGMYACGLSLHLPSSTLSRSISSLSFSTSSSAFSSSVAEPPTPPAMVRPTTPGACGVSPRTTRLARCCSSRSSASRPSCSFLRSSASFCTWLTTSESSARRLSMRRISASTSPTRSDVRSRNWRDMSSSSRRRRSSSSSMSYSPRQDCDVTSHTCRLAQSLAVVSHRVCSNTTSHTPVPAVHDCQLAHSRFSLHCTPSSTTTHLPAAHRCSLAHSSWCAHRAPSATVAQCRCAHRCSAPQSWCTRHGVSSVTLLMPRSMRWYARSDCLSMLRRSATRLRSRAFVSSFSARFLDLRNSSSSRWYLANSLCDLRALACSYLVVALSSSSCSRSIMSFPHGPSPASMARYRSSMARARLCHSSCSAARSSLSCRISSTARIRRSTSACLLMISFSSARRCSCLPRISLICVSRSRSNRSSSAFCSASSCAALTRSSARWRRWISSIMCAWLRSSSRRSSSGNRSSRTVCTRRSSWSHHDRSASCRRSNASRIATFFASIAATACAVRFARASSRMASSCLRTATLCSSASSSFFASTASASASASSM